MKREIDLTEDAIFSDDQISYQISVDKDPVPWRSKPYKINETSISYFDEFIISYNESRTDINYFINSDSEDITNSFDYDDWKKSFANIRPMYNLCLQCFEEEYRKLPWRKEYICPKCRQKNLKKKERNCFTVLARTSGLKFERYHRIPWKVYEPNLMISKDLRRINRRFRLWDNEINWQPNGRTPQDYDSYSNHWDWRTSLSKRVID